jgi:DNA-binding transcriptional ArsR family regulator
MGIDARTVQRHIARLENAGLVKPEERRISKVGSKSNIYHFDGLIGTGQPFAKEMLETKNGNIAARVALRAQKGKPKLALVKDSD